MLFTSWNPRSAIPIIGVVLFFFSLLFYRSDFHKKLDFHSGSSTEAEKPAIPPPVLRPTPEANAPVRENFASVAYAKSSEDVPPVPSFNKPREYNEASDGAAPLMIGFTRNWPVLQQAVVSYIAAGWPAEQIYVVENTGTMYANRWDQLSLQNPFYINYHRLTEVLKVNVLTTPSYLSFAQLQNYMMFTALERGWYTYFWSHMDVAALSDEHFTMPDKDDPEKQVYLSLFDRVILKRRDLIANADHWALHFFAYDRLTLVNLQVYMDVGGWDPMIGYYTGDCDFYERLRYGKYEMGNTEAGMVADVGSSLLDLGVLYRRIGWPNGTHDEKDGKFGREDELGGEGFDKLKADIEALQEKKGSDGPGGRNFWQSEQQGGQGEPFYKDSEGFERSVWYHIALGRKVFAEKWGHRDCNILEMGLKPEDAWRVQHDGDWQMTVAD